LIQYKYIGQWSINMLLMFSYYRHDIFPCSDFGIIKGIKKLYNVENITPILLQQLTNKFRNYLTLFSFCLWKIGVI
jgi:DNA-3-methyladenine glycosylase II